MRPHPLALVVAAVLRETPPPQSASIQEAKTAPTQEAAEIVQNGVSTEKSGSKHRLTGEQAQQLVLNTPQALASKARGGCREAELDAIYESEGLASLQVRNMCSKAPSGLINNFSVDLKNGEVWVDDRRHLIDSNHLKELRGKFLAQKR